MKLFLDFTLKRTWGALERFWGRALHFPLLYSCSSSHFSFFGTKVKLNGEKSCVVVVVLLTDTRKTSDSILKQVWVNLKRSLLLPYLIYFLDLLWRIPGACEERGQKNKQFYRVYRSLRKWCESKASSLPTPLILLLHYYISNERSIMIFFLDVSPLTLCSSDYCLLSVYRKNRLRPWQPFWICQIGLRLPYLSGRNTPKENSSMWSKLGSC